MIRLPLRRDITYLSVAYGRPCSGSGRETARFFVDEERTCLSMFAGVLPAAYIERRGAHRGSRCFERIFSLHVSSTVLREEPFFKCVPSFPAKLIYHGGNS